MSFDGKVALVTGGTSGIGRETAIQFARAGAKVVLAGRRKEEGEAVVNEIKSGGGDAHFVQADVTREDQVKHLVDETVARYGRLDIAFNNAGIELTGPITEFTEEGTEGRQQLASQHSMGRLGEPKEIAAAVLYLASDAASFTTGISLPVDGGYLAK